MQIPKQASEAAAALMALDAWRQREPSRFYRPHAGQESFHRSRHTTRIMAPGNRWGKSTAMMVEADWWLNGKHRYQSVPKQDCLVLWLAPQYRQFELLKPQIESQALTAGWSWNMQKSKYEWENGSELWVIPADRDWYYIQGINPDLVLCDEEPPLPLWRELLTRRFGYRNGRKVRTRYVIGATATQSESWMERELYTPWLEHHAKLGLSETQAMAVQSHPEVWCWPRGGIADNPMAEAADVAHYQSISWTSQEEKRVRMGGGFANFSGQTVFDRDGMAWVKQQSEALDTEHPGVNGAIR
jgi:hypothetical protein